MISVRNKLNQRLIVNLTGGRNIDILARGAAEVSDKELPSPHLQALVTKGDVVVIRDDAGVAREMEKQAGRKQGRKKSTGK